MASQQRGAESADSVLRSPTPDVSDRVTTPPRWSARLRQREGEAGVPGRDGDELPAVDGVADGRGANPGAERHVPQVAPRVGVERDEVALAVAGEHQARGRRGHARPRTGELPELPAGGARSRIDRANRAFLGFAGIGEERAADVGTARAMRRLEIVVDAKSLAILNKVPLSGHPNNMAVSKDGGRVYVGIAQAPGGVDVIDTAYVTPDGRLVVAGSIPAATITVIDAKTEEPAWTLKMDLGIRPMTFSTNRDGSTKWIFTQLTGFKGFAVVDFATRKEIRRVENPPLPPGKMTVPQGSDPSHGMAVTADGKTLVVCSRLNNYLYSYSLPDLKLVGSAELGGKGAGWVTLTPDGKTAYVANPVTNDVSVVDIASMKETTRIPVGFVPKRNVTVSLQ